MKEKVGIIGLGYVGGAVHNWFQSRKAPPTDLFLYDKFKEIGSVEEVNKANIVFIAVPTPYHEGPAYVEASSGRRGYDDSAIMYCLNILKKPKIVVIKSTILPGSTEMYQRKFPRHSILFSPEFLVAKTAKQDFIKPLRQIVGYTEKSKRYAKRVMALLPQARFAKIIGASEAEMVKYFGNTFLSTRVVFANQIYDLCAKLRINYDLVKESAGADPRIGYSHFDIFFDGYRGYGGACLPKDIRALIDLGKKHVGDFSLLEVVDRINNDLQKNGKGE